MKNLLPFALAAITPATAYADVVHIGGVQVGRDGKMCFIEAQDNLGTSIVFAREIGGTKFYVQDIGNSAWTSLVPGKHYKLAVLTRGDSYDVDAQAVPYGGRTYLMWSIPAWVVENAIERMKPWSVDYQGHRLTYFNLGSGDVVAIRALNSCAGMGNDPFAH